MLAAAVDAYVAVRRAAESPAAPRPCPADPAAGEYGWRAEYGSRLAVAACVVEWSEPGWKAKGGDTW